MRFLRWAALAAIAAAACPIAAAQRPDGDRLRRMRDVLERAAAPRPVTDADAARMLALLDRAETDGLSAADRRAAVTDLYAELSRLRGFDAGAAARSNRMPAAIAAAAYGAGATFSLDTHAPPPGSAEGRIAVVKRGRGPVPVVLISDLMIPGDVLYDSFMMRNARRYTMYAVTLPGFGDARVPPRPEHVDYSRVPWLNAAERQIAELLVREDLRDAVVVGTAAGGYFSAALAARHPDRIRAAVVVNGLVHSPLRSPADPNRPASAEERREAARMAVPIELTPAFWPPASRDAYRELLTNPPASSGWSNPMAFAVSDGKLALDWAVDHFTPAHVWRQARYGAELGATDLTPDLMKLTRPILVVASLHDFASPGIGVPVEGQWTELKIRAPEAPVTIVTMADVRHYASIDAPDLFDAALADFLAGRPVTGTTERAPAALPSPFASSRLHVGASELRIDYFRPAVRDREIWGALVPYDRLWRTGANEAPTLTFSRDVTIEGRPLPAGRYTLLTIPGRTSWTLIFNRIPGQFGTFVYDPAFDALRVEVAPRPAGMHERFEISAEPTGPAQAVVSLRWDRLSVPFTVALEPE